MSEVAISYHNRLTENIVATTCGRPKYSSFCVPIMIGLIIIVIIIFLYLYLLTYLLRLLPTAKY